MIHVIDVKDGAVIRAIQEATTIYRILDCSGKIHIGEPLGVIGSDDLIMVTKGRLHSVLAPLVNTQLNFTVWSFDQFTEYLDSAKSNEPEPINNTMLVRITNSAFWYGYGDEYYVSESHNGMWYKTNIAGYVKYIRVKDCEVINPFRPSLSVDDIVIVEGVPRHFAGWEGNKIVVYDFGRTSYTAGNQDGMSSYIDYRIPDTEELESYRVKVD